ncbi:uncharacterized protein BKCO1_2500070 [Diplodia corticola]|uniref:Uncharacterized protein n=1 Tax=Diplodia corticola TaxID=236234 RepID=A0A1J9RNB2_9PEZI|nr:uncharacterized protein BKCO1_2500070 [Diplodia corticola]OJD34043.1 hypothetical protein BKCO1_2500070 [Diplodia corticola]
MSSAPPHSPPRLSRIASRAGYAYDAHRHPSPPPPFHGDNSLAKRPRVHDNNGHDPTPRTPRKRRNTLSTTDLQEMGTLKAQRKQALIPYFFTDTEAAGRFADEADQAMLTTVNNIEMFQEE